MPKFKFSIEGETDWGDETFEESSNHIQTVIDVLRDWINDSGFTVGKITVKEVEPGAGADR